MSLTREFLRNEMFFPGSPKTETELQRAKSDLIFGNQNHQLYIPFDKTFKCLGCRIAESLNDEVEISHRLTQASNQVAALKNFWNSSVDLQTKRQIFLAIPVNTALCGCESWTLTTQLRTKVNSFYHKAIRQVLGINMHHAEQFHIRNKHIRNRLLVPDPLDIIRRRQFNQLGKFARLPDDRLPRKLLTAWIMTPRQVGRPRNMLRHSYVEALRHTIGERTPDNGALNSWTHLAQQKTQWENLSLDWIERRTAVTIVAYGDHPLLGNGVREDKFAHHFPSTLEDVNSPS